MTRFAIIAAATLVLSAAAVAQTPAVDLARAQGLVGERYDGYLGVAAPVSQTLRADVARINIQRRALYSRLAASKGATPQDVGVTAGCQLLARVPIGGSYLWPNGGWQKRAASAAAPVPTYCG
jgi:uncharacterized protein YdbL (DUF1318 family)